MNRYWETPRAEYAHEGTVTLANAKTVQLSGHTALREVKQVLPFGISTVPMQGTTALLLPVEGGEYVLLGTVGLPDGAADSGEIVLRSQGGAQIKLKNNGEIELNGLVITAKGEIKSG